MPIEPERMPEEERPTKAGTRIAVQTPDGMVREVEVTPEKARAYAWMAAKYSAAALAAAFGLGWGIRTLYDGWQRENRKRRRRHRDDDED